MPRSLDVDKDVERLLRDLGRAFQSANLNLLVGSGASHPAISPAGAIEQEIRALFVAGNEVEAIARVYAFLAGIQQPTNALIAELAVADINTTLSAYRQFLASIEGLLTARETNILAKQANLFTTNYDLFIEKASEARPTLRLNDGFVRTPSIASRARYSSNSFFDALFNSGNVYRYRVEVPTINLIKLHGSLSWKRAPAHGDDIEFNVSPIALLDASADHAQRQEFISGYTIVLPQASKFRETVLERTYYDLLRIYANELDKENTLLVAFGFSFSDEHILEITRRALRNPTLKLIAFAFDESATNGFLKTFDGYNNVDVVHAPHGHRLDFAKFNDVLKGVLPSAKVAV